MQILVLNGGSSSIKFSVFSVARGSGNAENGKGVMCLLEGQITGIGEQNAILQISSNEGNVEAGTTSVGATTVEHAMGLVLDSVSRSNGSDIEAIGYRVVHPGPHLQGHQKVTAAVLESLEQAAGFAPLHDPEALVMIRETMKRFPSIPHYVCFDTVFHETMSEEATAYPLPPEYRAMGVHRYGFHGLSCESIVRQMQARADLPKRMVIAHLGSGCSVTAVSEGRSIDTTMGLTPTGGVVMGTRSGDLDPGLVLYLLRQQTGGREHAVAAVESLLNHKSGIASLSRMDNDVRAVRAAAKKGNAEALLSMKVFTRSITKAIGGFCWLLGGLDAIVFTGGIGEHDPESRSEILAGLTRLGLQLAPQSPSKNSDGIHLISANGSTTDVLVVPAQEDLVIALHVERMAQSEQ